MAGDREPPASEIITDDQKLAFLKENARKLEEEIESKKTHNMDMVLRVSSVALQFGQLGKIWGGFVPEKEIRERMKIPFDEDRKFLYSFIGDNLGREFFGELQKNIKRARGNIVDSFSIDSLKKIAAISNMMGLWIEEMECIKEMDAV